MNGLQIRRHYTHVDSTPDDLRVVAKKKFDAKVEGVDPKTGAKKTIFEMKDVEAPEGWTQHAVDIAASKYFRKAGVPNDRGHEYSVFAMVSRVAKTIRESGEAQGGYFASEGDARIFEKELAAILLTQRAAFNSPVWFNVGLWHQYGISGNGVNFAYNPSTMKVEPVKNYFERPQASACFIQPVGDSLESIFELVAAESRVFKGGSGTGTNFSTLRSRFEKLTGGGKSSGLLSFLNVFDRGAGSIKSGGTTRRAAKMVVVDADHPEIFDFVSWKVEEEKKARALIAAGYDADFNGEAYQTVSGQNANNSIRVTDEFMQAVEDDLLYATRYRTTGGVHESFPARKLWRAIAEAAWFCADPGLQFDSVINDWHTVPKTARINASNPCGEFHHVDNSACNLASINLLKFLRADGTFDIEGFEHTARVVFLAMEILVDLSSYPTAPIAENSHRLRPLGLGYTNLGALLMTLGFPYDSDEARSWAAAVTSLMCAVAYRTSAEMARTKGPFAEFAKNRGAMLRVMEKHQDAVSLIGRGALSEAVRNASLKAWEDARALGARHGYRNAQATLLAPTGTIAFLMGCDTTGIEPDFSLIKVKKLAGGGEMLIVNESVGEALRRLHYNDNERATIEAHIKMTGGVEFAPMFDGKHLAIFDCAAPSRAGGRCISPRGHLLMMAAVQPFLSGSISKTVNVPSDATVEDFEALYFESWKLGLKAVAIYRDGCKMSQPLNAGGKKEEEKTAPLVDELAILREENAQLSNEVVRLRAALSAAKTAPPLQRSRLPKRRKGWTQEARIGGQKIYIRTGEYGDGKLGELFIDMHKQGSTLRSLMNSFAISISIGLQYGVPLEEYADVFTFTRFEPAGMTDHSNIRSATSVLDFIFRLLALEYLGRTDLAHVAPEEKPLVNAPQRSGTELADGGELAVSRDPISPELASKLDAAVISFVGKERAKLNGKPNGIAADSLAKRAPTHGEIQASIDLARFQSDAPICPACGNLTIRNGACYKCLNCGESLGCS